MSSSNRITPTMLRTKVDTLNHLLGQSSVAWREGKAIVGTYVLGSAYGGWSVAVICNEAGGERHALGMYGHVPARECAAHLDAAIWMARELNSAVVQD